jgi:alkanesulfonate monooxygenase SsuD/methylene tetrahydromethanopterin reductase-like flavin-dependent oxidoreductase (luciferase family)
MTAPLRIGIMLPSRETAMTGRHDAPGLVDFAKAAEVAGFDSVWVGDSLLARTRAEPLSILAAVAVVTDRVELGTAALIAPLRHPLLAAAQVATVDQLSGGRLILGLGSGSPLPESRREFDAVGMPFAARGARLDEMTRLWRQAGAGGVISPTCFRRRGQAAHRCGWPAATRRKSSTGRRAHTTAGCRICPM